MSDPEQPAFDLQRHYYAQTACTYDDMHEKAEHHDALRHTAVYLRSIDARSLLDTGCGTGLAMLHLAAEVPGLKTRGNDPSAELLAIASDRHGIAPETLDCVSSEALPYGDATFDAVIETGMLHHVPHPEKVVSEMLRVARLAVFISDSNIYGQAGASLPARVLKLGLARCGLLRPLLRQTRGGHDWYYTEGDGVAWSYSVFDSYAQVRDACADVVVVPTGAKRSLADACPLLFSTHCLLAGFKQPLPSLQR